MSKTAQDLIKSAMRVAGVIATGETPTDAEMQDGLEALQFMLENWSASNIRLYYTKQESLTLTGAASYTIGSGGDLDTVRPASIRGAWTDLGPVSIIGEDRYRQVRMDTNSADVAYLWYSPEYPLGVLYPWPAGGSTLYIDSLKPLTDPATLTTDVAFPPEYNAAVKFNLAAHIGVEFGIEVSATVAALAASSLSAIEDRNFAEQINEIRPELIKLSYERYNIDRE